MAASKPLPRLLPLLLLAGLAAASSPACLDEQGNQLDWFLAYKLPAVASADEQLQSGHVYAYISSAGAPEPPPSAPAGSRATSLFRRLLASLGLQGGARQSRGRPPASTGDGWTVSQHLISDPQHSMILKTLAIAYDARQGAKLNSLFYSDQPPKAEAARASGAGARAHAKGVLLFDDVSRKSVWLSHSTPLFPPARNESLKFEANARVYGQTFMCVSFELDAAGKQVVEHLATMRPHVYDHQISERLFALLPELRGLLGPGRLGKGVRRAPSRAAAAAKLAQTIATRAGQQLRLFSKGPGFNRDLYADWLELELSSSLYVASWRNGAGNPLNSSCPRDGTFKVNNVQELQLRAPDQARVEWNYHHDHSKWAISEEPQHGHVCIADINRMESQFKRGGGAICIHCPACWRAFSATIAEVELCPVGARRSASSSAGQNNSH